MRKFGHATAALLAGKLPASSRQNALAAALKEYGALRRSIYAAKYLSDPDYRRRIAQTEPIGNVGSRDIFGRSGFPQDRSVKVAVYAAMSTCRGSQYALMLMSERTRDGLAAARTRGRIGGQNPKLGPRQVKLARQMYDELDEVGKRRYSVDRIAAEFGAPRRDASALVAAELLSTFR